MTYDAITETRLMMRHADFDPLPALEKRVTITGWPTFIQVPDQAIINWAGMRPNDKNTGILCTRTPCVDIDILDKDAAELVENVAREMFEEGGYFITRIGKWPKRAFVLRTDEPFDKIIASIEGPGGSKHKIEVQARGEQLVAYGIHPETKEPYQWHGGKPGEVKREELPYCNEQIIRNFLEQAKSALEQHGYKVTIGKPKATNGSNGQHYEKDSLADREQLIRNILAGDQLHDSLRDLAASMISSGANKSAVKSMLKGLMESSQAVKDARFWDRYKEIDRDIDSAFAKFGKEQEQQDQTKPKPRSIELIVPQWDGIPIPPRLFLDTKKRLPLGKSVLFTGDGGIGKTTIANQLAIAVAMRHDWIGTLIEHHGPVIFFTAEEDRDEMWRRCDAITRPRGITYKQLADAGYRLVCRPGEDSILGAPNKQGVVTPTALFDELMQIVGDTKPVLLVLEAASDLFAGNENDRSQVKQFGNMITRLCTVASTTIVMLQHPSMAGLASGSGTSGSTQWRNAFRAQINLTTADDEDEEGEETNYRLLHLRKANYAKEGEKIKLDWREGVFVDLTVPAQNKGHIDQVYLDCLDERTRQNMWVSARPSRSGATALFPRMTKSCGYKSKDFEAAQERLLERGLLKVETCRVNGRPFDRITRTKVTDYSTDLDVGDTKGNGV